MPTNRPNVTLRADEADRLLDLARELDNALNSPSRSDMLESWASTIHRIKWIVSDAVQDAESRARRRGPERDSQRSKVYRAEGSIKGVRPKLLGIIPQAQWLQANVLALPWFRQHWPEITEANVRITRSRSKVISTYYYRFGAHQLDLVADASDATILHEIAHACHRVWYGNQAAAHDANFVGIVVALTAVVLGRGPAVELARAFTTAGCKAVPFTRQSRPVATPAKTA
jgi:hypothetical protein